MRVILVDDEPLALEYLERQIKKNKNIEIVKKLTYFNLQKYESLLHEIDLIFLDIEMPGINGLELAEKIIAINPSLAIVFVTAFDEYAVQAFELNALDYLLKPIQLDRLQKTLERIEQNRNHIEKPLVTDKHLQINVFGELTFEHGGQLEVIKWRTAKAQELFLYLLHHAGQTIRKSKLAELLWPEFEQNKAYSQLYTAVYNIRKSLAKYKSYISLKNMQEGYILFIKNSKVDIVELETKILSLLPIHINVISIYESAMNLYINSYLGEYDYVWAESERFRLEQIWLKTAKQIAHCYAENDYMKEAIEWYIEICELSPDDTKANFALMKLYAELGYGLLVNHQYETLKRTLEELGVGMDQEISDWYRK